MSITAYLKEIARGKDGARSLDAARAEDLLRQVFAGEASEVQIGAFLIAMRINMPASSTPPKARSEWFIR